MRRDQLEVADRERSPADQVDRTREGGARDPGLELVAVLRRRLDPERRRNVEVDVGLVAPPRRQSFVGGRDSFAVDGLRGLELAADVVAVVGGPRRERRPVRLRSLVEEQRPRVRLRLRDPRGDAAGPELLQACDVVSAAVFSSGAAPSPTEGGRVSTPTVVPASRGAGTGLPVSTDQAAATSATVVAIGPTVSSVGQRGNTPSSEIEPHRGLSPTVSQQADGRRIEQPVSVASPRSQRPAASAAALPPLEPPVVRPGRTRIPDGAVPGVLARHAPGELVQVRLPDEHAPASTSLCTTAAVPSGTWSA